LSALAPVGAYKLAGAGATDDIANVLQDTLMGFGMKAEGAADAGRRFAADEFGGAGPGKQGIRAYHGSPHSFDRFSMDAIGTGEGAQAYGHGLYFAENEAVARGYRDALKHKSQGITVNGEEKVFATTPKEATPEEIATLWVSQALENHGEAWPARMKARNVVLSAERGDLSSFQKEAGWGDLPKMKEAASIIDKWDGAKIEKMPQGSMYEVNINANPDDFLDWDAPLSAQPENVRRGFGQASAGNDPLLSELLDGSPESIPLMGLFPNSKGSQAYNSLMEKGFEEGAVGLNLPAGNPMKPADKWSSERLRSAGIPGIKYKDAGSRGVDGDGTRNFVVFDENLIEIVKKYGIAGAAAMLGVSAADVEDAINGT
jgi:hypothetical protein